MPKVAELRISIHHEGPYLSVVLEGDELLPRTTPVRRVTFDASSDVVRKLVPDIIVAVHKCLQRALAAGRPKPPREEP